MRSLTGNKRESVLRLTTQTFQQNRGFASGEQKVRLSALDRSLAIDFVQMQAYFPRALSCPQLVWNGVTESHCTNIVVEFY